MVDFAAWGPGDWIFFLLANSIVCGICVPPLVRDIRRWRSASGQGGRSASGQGGRSPSGGAGRASSGGS
jgi:hypothetical protein